MASKHAPNVLISAAGWLMQFVSLLIKGLLARGWDNERIHALATDKGAADMDRLVEAVLNAFAAPLAPVLDLATGICRFAVDYTKSLEEMIAAGKYDWRNNDITSQRFLIVGNGTVVVDAKLFHFNRNMKSDAVERELAAAGYRSATIAELLAFGVAFPETQRQFPIIALGSSTTLGGYRNVPYLLRYDARRNLRLYWGVNEWYGGCRFLAVRIK